MQYGVDKKFQDADQEMLFSVIAEHDTCSASRLLKDKRIIRMIRHAGEKFDGSRTFQHRLRGRIRALKSRLEKRGFSLPAKDYGKN